jgi:lipase (class 2)
VLGGRKARVVVVASLLAWPSVARAQGNVTPALPGAPRCRPSDASPTAPQGGHTEGPPAPAYFAPDFPRLTDSLWGDRPLGGFGGVHRRAPLHHTPVVFVHGNQVDAENWLSVMLQFQNDAGYTMQEMYAVSYNGLENHAAGAPVQHQATAPDEDYLRLNPAALGTAGHGSANDDEVPNLCRFIEAVQWYTGSRQVDVVAHSLGVTIIRKLMVDYPSLARDIVAFVGIAGGNHGTTLCRGLDTSYYGCNEIAPGTPWLAALNRRQAYAPSAWMMVYNGTVGDPFFVPPLDQTSPAMRGAVDVAFPGQYHNDLRVGPAEVDTYLPFVLARGQAGPGADHRGRADAVAISAARPDGTQGELCGVPALTGPVRGCPR